MKQFMKLCNGLNVLFTVQNSWGARSDNLHRWRALNNQW